MKNNEENIVYGASGYAIKKVLKPAAKREMVKYLQDAYEISERRSCKVLKINKIEQHTGINPGRTSIRF